MKNQMRRFLALLLVFSICVSFLLMDVSAGETGLQIFCSTNANNTIKQTDDVVRVTVKLSQATSVLAYGLKIDYDADVFSLVTDSSNHYVFNDNSFSLTTNKKTGVIYVNATKTDSPQITDLFYFDLKVLNTAKAGRTDITVSADDPKAYLAGEDEKQIASTFGEAAPVYIAGLDVTTPEAGTVPIGTSISDLNNLLTVKKYVAGEDPTTVTATTDFKLTPTNSEGTAFPTGITKTSAGDNYFLVSSPAGGVSSAYKIIDIVCPPVSGTATIPASAVYGTDVVVPITFTTTDPSVTGLTLSLPAGASSFTLGDSVKTFDADKKATTSVTLAAGTSVNTYTTTVSATYTWNGKPYTASVPVSVTLTPADFQYEITPANINVKVGTATVDAVTGTLTVTNKGYQDKPVSGTRTWYSDELHTKLAANAMFSGAKVGDTVTLYWKFVPDASNYMTDPKTGMVVCTIVDGDPQTVTITDPGAKTFGDANFQMTAAAKNANVDDTNAAITWTSSAPETASVTTDGLVTIHHAGSVTLTATAAAVPGQYAQGTATFSLTIARKDISGATVLPNPPVSYDGTSQTLGVADVLIGGSSIGAGNYTVTNNTYTDAGNYQLTITGQNDYTGTAHGPGIILPRSITISATAPNVTFNGSKQAPTVTVTSGLLTLVKDTDYTVDYGENINAGTGQFTVKPVTGGNYVFSNYSGSFTIGKATAPHLSADGVNLLSKTVTKNASHDYSFDLSTLIKNIPANAGTLTYTVANPTHGTAAVSGKTLNVTITAPQDADAEEEITVTVGSTNYADAIVVITGTYIDKTDVSDDLVFENKTVTYGEDAAMTASYSGADANSKYTYSYQLKGSTAAPTEVPPTAAGTYEVTVTYDDIIMNGVVPGHTGTKTVTLVIQPLQITVTANDKTIFFNDAVPNDFTKTVTPALPYGDTLSVTFDTADYTKGANVGSYVITPVVVPNPNYEIITQDGTLTVSQLDFTGKTTISKGAQLVYNTNEQTQEITVKVGETTTLTDEDYTVAGNTATDAGSYTLTITGQGNYTGTATLDYTVNQKPVTVSAALTDSETPIVYSGTAKQPAVTVTAEDGTVLEQGADYGVAYSNNITAGNARFDITPNTNSNYSFAATYGNFTITPAQLNAAYVGETVYVNDEIAGKVIVTGFVPGESASSISGYTAPTVTADTSIAGVYSNVTPVGGVAANYTFTYTAGTLTVLDRITGTVAPAPSTADPTNPNNGKYSVSQSTSPTDKNTVDVSVNATTPLVGSTPEGLGAGTWIGLSLKNFSSNGSLIANAQYSTDGGKTWKPVTNDTVWVDVSSAAPTVMVRDASNHADTLTMKIHYTPAASAVKGFTVSIGDYDGGSVKTDKVSAESGEKVTLTPRADADYQLNKLTVTDTAGNVIPLTENADGTYSFTMPARSVVVSAVFQSNWTNPYRDVRENDWFFDDVRYVTEKGLMNGSNLFFSPDAYATRAQIVTVLWRMAGSPAAGSNAGFTDLTQDWYKEAVNWAAEKGITVGVGNGRFDPNGIVTREQFATFLYRYAVMQKVDVSASDSLAAYTDRADVSAWALTAVKWAVADGILNGAASRLNPASAAVRAQLAAMIARYDKAHN